MLRAKQEHALAAEQRRHYDEEQQEYNIQRSQQVRREQQQSRERRRLEQVQSNTTAPFPFQDWQQERASLPQRVEVLALSPAQQRLFEPHLLIPLIVRLQQRRLEETHSNYDARVAEEERKVKSQYALTCSYITFKRELVR